MYQIYDENDNLIPNGDFKLLRTAIMMGREYWLLKGAWYVVNTETTQTVYRNAKLDNKE